MKINELIQVGTREESYIENGVTLTRTVPVMASVTREMTAEEEAAMAVEESPEAEIAALKQRLAETDYMAIKYAEGWLSETAYSATKAQRQAWRDRINEIEETAGE